LVGIRTQDHLEKNTSSCLNQLSYWIRQEMRQFLRALSRPPSATVRRAQARPSAERDRPPSATVRRARPSAERDRPPRARDSMNRRLSTVKSHTALNGLFSFVRARNGGCQSLLHIQFAGLQPQRAMLPHKHSFGLLHSLASLVSSQPTSCFARELPFLVTNAGRQTSCSIEALYTSIAGTH
jgi:hypothetical protein